MQKWEYKIDARILVGRTEVIERFLNDMGKDGWELINIQRIPYLPEGSSTLEETLYYYFKRPKNH